VDFESQPGWLAEIRELELVTTDLKSIGDDHDVLRGQRVRVRLSIDEPRYGWGQVEHGEVGSVVKVLPRDEDGDESDSASEAPPKDGSGSEAGSGHDEAAEDANQLGIRHSWLRPLHTFDKFMELSFTSAVLLCNLYVVFLAHEPLEMVLNSIALEFIVDLDNNFKAYLLSEMNLEERIIRSYTRQCRIEPKNALWKFVCAMSEGASTESFLQFFHPKLYGDMFQAFLEAMKESSPPYKSLLSTQGLTCGAVSVLKSIGSLLLAIVAGIFHLILAGLVTVMLILLLVAFFLANLAAVSTFLFSFVFAPLVALGVTVYGPVCKPE
jgi:hypothetical protein